MLESTRSTVTINHGTNGTAEKTTVDTNPQKVLEHANLISDSEYITLDHKTGTNTTHIQAVKLKEKLDELQQNKQDVLTAGSGISKTTTGNVTTIGLKTIDNYSGDLNELTETCLVKPTIDAANRPDIYDGILTVVKIGDIVSQKYHTPGNKVFTRVGKYFEGEWTWTPWAKVGDPT